MKKLVVLVLIIVSSVGYAKTYSPFCFNSKYGIIDESRNVVIQPVYKDINVFKNLCIVCEPEDSGQIVYTPDLKKVYTFEKKVAIWEKYNDRELRLGKKLLFNLDTLEVYSRTFDEKYNSEYGYRNNRQVVLMSNEDDSQPYNIFRVVDRKHKIFTPKLLQADTWYSEGLLPVIFLEGKSGYINENGKLIIEVPLYDDERTADIRISPNLNYSFNEGIALVQTEKDVWQLLDKGGTLKKLPEEYTYYARIFSNGLLLIENSEQKFGFMNRNADVAIPCIFDSAKTFKGKYAIVVYRSKDAVVDTDGNIYYCEDFCK